MAEVLFYSVKTQFKLTNKRKVIKWLVLICDQESQELESLHYIFCSDAFLGELNKKYLHHSTLTDILSFDYSTSHKLVGEIYISIPRVMENARIYKQPFDSELRRVLSHGLLHFMGYRDKTKTQKAQMRMKEEACLSLWK